MSLKNIYARIPQHLLEKLSALAEERNQTTSELIRGIVTAFLAPAECVTDSDAYAKAVEANGSNQPNQFIDDSIELDW